MIRITTSGMNAGSGKDNEILIGMSDLIGDIIIQIIKLE